MVDSTHSAEDRAAEVRVCDFAQSLAVFGGFALLGAIQNHIWSQGTPDPSTWGKSLVNGAIWMLPWGFIAPAIKVVEAKLPHRDRRPWAFFLGHLGGMVATIVPLYLLQLGLGALGVLLLKGWSLRSLTFLHPTLDDVFRVFLGIPLVYGAIAATWAALRQAMARREQEARTALLAEQLSQARLALLKQQLHPHFLFNALQAVSTLLHRDPVAADRAVLSLSALLRRMLDDSGIQMTSLRTEVELVRRYLEIEQVRFQDRLTLAITAEEEALEVPVPSLVILPLVENAIRHGISRNPAPGRVKVDARLEGPYLLLRVEDDGPGAKLPLQEHVGLASTRQRLEAMYGAEARLDLTGQGLDGKGFLAAVTLPTRMIQPSQMGA